MVEKLKVDPKTRMILCALSELFQGVSASIAAGMMVERTVAVPEAWPALLLLGFVVGFGRAWGEIKLWMRGGDS